MDRKRSAGNGQTSCPTPDGDRLALVSEAAGITAAANTRFTHGKSAEKSSLSDKRLKVGLLFVALVAFVVAAMIAACGTFSVDSVKRRPGEVDLLDSRPTGSFGVGDCPLLRVDSTGRRNTLRSADYLRVQR